MKNLVLLFALGWLSGSAQAKMFLKDGTVVDIQNNYMDTREKFTFYYKLPNSEKVERIPYKKIDYVAHDGFRLFMKKIGNLHFYDLLAENQGMKLYGGSEYLQGTTFHEMIVTDSRGKVLDYVTLKDRDSKTQELKKARMVSMVRQYFGDCPKLMDRVGYYDTEEGGKSQIVFIFSNLQYIDCR